MDCYKWAYKLAPVSSSELVADCFALAHEVREVDMRASPYDLRSLGVDPIPIETAAGKAAYVKHQRDFAERSNVLRRRLIAVCDAALSGDPAVLRRPVEGTPVEEASVDSSSSSVVGAGASG